MTLLHEAGRLYLDVTALIPVENHDLDKDKICGVDLGIIHPFALASGNDALVVSGRALRAEERLHLSDTKERARKMGGRTPRKGQRGSRRVRIRNLPREGQRLSEGALLRFERLLQQTAVQGKPRDGG